MNAIDKIKTTGRLTKQKTQLLQTLSDRPQTVAQIIADLGQHKVKINPATVYRILENFSTLGIVQKIQLADQVARYELTEHRHHHHLICKKCGSIADVVLDQENFVQAAARQSKFMINRHTLEFFGVCQKCQE